MVERGLRHQSANDLDAACTNQSEAIEFSSIMTIGNDAMLKARSATARGKARRGLEWLQHPWRGGFQPYSPVKLPSSREALLKAMVVGLEATNAILPSPLYTDPLLSLVAILAIFKATLDSPSIASKDKVQVTEAGD